MNLRLATFNLLDLGLREPEDTLERRSRLADHVRELRAVIRRIDADAMAFQEVLEPQLLTTLLDGLGYEHIVLADRASSPLRVGVFSRYPLRDPGPVATQTRFQVSDAKTGMELALSGPFSRPVFRVVWEAPGLETTLFVVHWKSKIPSKLPWGGGSLGWSSLGQAAEGRLLTEIKRLAQAMELRKVLDGELEADPEAGIAVLGDFNDSLDSEGLRIVRGDARACESPHLRTFELTPAELSIPADLRFTQIYRGHREMLDHILVSPGLRQHLVGCQAYNDALAEAQEGPAPDRYSDGSDHAPLVATFQVRSTIS